MIVQPPQQGLCVPSTCSDGDIMKAYNAILKFIQKINEKYGVIEISHVHSYVKDSHSTLTTPDKICM